MGHSRAQFDRAHCTNNLKNILLATANYESTHGALPMAMGGTDVNGDPLQSNAGRLSGIVAMLPQIEQTALYDQITEPLDVDGTLYPPRGPAPWIAAYPAWTTQIELLKCPSAADGTSKFGQTNYALCIGDMARDIHQPTVARGAFACGLSQRMSKIKDGASNTIFFAEIGSLDGKRINGQYAIEQSDKLLDNPTLCLKLRDSWNKAYYPGNTKLSKLGRGGRWADGSAGDSLFNTILPPNSPSCAIDGDEAVDGLYSAGSQHKGGVNVGMGDGSVKFIVDSIDCGDLSQRTLTQQEMSGHKVASPFGIWGALGTADGAEKIGFGEY
ncbi:DUF1559 domain-containing protein [Blastopirellula sp. JC732]|uniref:DUF1559 domain-containing protein n=1 Tax=Blastopirellula sediminis TaxID=2894196 RepID=A0A9X1MNG5_9BACT|nr:DUF1559 domain-containing protein [Blastopirellula sediminis]MCC9606914.1 DUF1559 domain-containing protein [Blastopirellula sediminis]MCC9629791.1 DUF1559 domain-containing protein [Blastopirellula sediminis]